MTHHRSPTLHTRHTLTTTLLLVGALVTLCACFCGTDDREEDDRKELASLTRIGKNITIDYSHTRKRRKQHHEQLFKDRTPTTSERITLTLMNDYTHPLKSSKNKDDRKALHRVKAKLSADAKADRIAYKLTGEPWELVFFVNGESFLRAPKDTLSGKPHWKSAPQLHDMYKEVYFAQKASSRDRIALLDYIIKRDGDAGMNTFLRELILHDSPPSNISLKKGTSRLSDKGRAAFTRMLKKMYTSGTKKDVRHLTLIMDYVPASDAFITARVWTLLDEFMRTKDIAFATRAFSQLLLQAGKQDIERASGLACTLLKERRSDFVINQEGRQLRLVALTLIARSKKACVQVPKMISKTPCKHGYLQASTGSLHTSTSVQPMLRREFQEGPIKSAYVRASEDGQYVLGAMLATGQAIPEKLQALTCKETKKKPTKR